LTVIPKTKKEFVFRYIVQCTLTHKDVDIVLFKTTYSDNPLKHYPAVLIILHLCSVIRFTEQWMS